MPIPFRCIGNASASTGTSSLRMKPTDASVENPKVFEDGGVSPAGTIVAICG
ncbi:MAG: hypothetical protein QGH39_08410 [Candidatus Thermoplasmatota archaeon]|nr:hypothetical protein [Candidatus Thermoplasmatota archaeon]